MTEVNERPYDASVVKELMNNTGGWAKSWDEVLRYLKGPATRDSDFSRGAVAALIRDIQAVAEQGLAYSNDYRILWTALTGEDASRLPVPERMRSPPTNPIELEDTYLRGLKFPAAKHEVLNRARRNQAPRRVINVLAEIEDQDYDDMATLLEEIGDYAWDYH